MNLKLKEILWEITPKCNRRCSCCGSKEILDCKQMSDGAILKVANNISDYFFQVPGTKNLTLTGGEPLLVDILVIKAIVDTLHNAECSVSVITNGDLLKTEHLGLFDNVGISVNNENNINNITDKWMIYEDYKEKITFVTNFGLQNIFDFDIIANFINNVDGLWQLQLTMGKNQLDKNGIKYLYEKINSCNTKYILADNLQTNHNCMAGLNSMGILYNGMCVPCVSIRAWGGVPCGDYNILDKPLQDIWENSFKNIRFGDKKCDSCRNHIDYSKNIACLSVCKKDVLDEFNKLHEQIVKMGDGETIPFPYTPQKTTHPVVLGCDLQNMMYAVFSRNNYFTTCANIAASYTNNK